MASSKPFEPKPEELLRHLLRRRRLELGLFQRVVGDRAGMSQQHVHFLESGRITSPPDATLLKIADALGVEPDYLATARHVSMTWRPPVRLTGGLLPHGTPGAHKRHRLRGEKPCQDCATWHRAYSLDAQRARRRRQGVPVAREAICGTTGGYSRHVRERTPICEPCRMARLTYDRQRLGQQPQSRSSGYIGVYANHENWVARVAAGGAIRWTKTYANPEEAARARDAKALELQGAKARLNFPRERAA